MATGIIGGVDQYGHVKETFVSYTEILEMFFFLRTISWKWKETRKNKELLKKPSVKEKSDISI